MLAGLPPELLEKVLHHIEDPEIFLENTDAWKKYKLMKTRSSLLYRRKYLCPDEDYEYLLNIVSRGWTDLLYSYEKPISDNDISALIDQACVSGQMSAFDFFLSEKKSQVTLRNLYEGLISALVFEDFEMAKEVVKVLIKNMKEDGKGFLVSVLLKICSEFKDQDLMECLTTQSYIQGIEILNFDYLKVSASELDREMCCYLTPNSDDPNHFVHIKNLEFKYADSRMLHE